MITPAYEAFVNDTAMELFGLSQKERDEKNKKNEAITKVKEFLSDKNNYIKICDACKSRAIALIKETTNDQDNCKTGTIGDLVVSDGKKVPNPKKTDLVLKFGGVNGFFINHIKENYHGSNGESVVISCGIKLSDNYSNMIIEKYGCDKSDKSISCVV